MSEKVLNYSAEEINQAIGKVQNMPTEGVKGEKGDTGPQGLQGEKGDQGIQGIQGAKGDKGDTGLTGEKGDKGDTGATPNITIGTVTTLQAGQQATVTRRGTTENPIFDFGIPKGERGVDGNGANIDLSQYATKQDVSNAIGSITTFPTGNLVLRDIIEGEIFEIEATSETPSTPTVTYGQIVLSKSSTTIAEGGTDTFTINLDKAPTSNQTVTLSKNNSDVTLNPSSLTFTSSNYSTPQIVTITAAEDDSDYSDETCVITCTSPNVTSKTLTVSITDNDTPVETIAVTGVKLDKTTHTFKVGETLQLTPTIEPDNATNKSVIWSADNSNCIVEAGLVTAKTEGDCVITCTTVDGSKTATCNITVQFKEEESPEDNIKEDVIIVNDGYMTSPLYNITISSGLQNYTQGTNNGYTSKRTISNPLFDYTDTNYSCDKFVVTPFGSFVSTLSEIISISGESIYIKLNNTNVGSDFQNYIKQSNAIFNIKLKDGIKILNISSNISNVETRTSGVNSDFEYVKFNYLDGFDGMEAFSSKYMISSGFICETTYCYSKTYENIKFDITNGKIELLLKKGTLSAINEDAVKEYLTNAKLKLYWI